VNRPFYREFAWAYDSIIEAPKISQVDFIQDMLSQCSILPGSKILDAGCGTGNYAIALTQRGYVGTGVDASAELISVARNKAEIISSSTIFVVGDILTLPVSAKFDAILCRGVLNDLIDDDSRQKVFFSFSRALRKGGVLILDVREWNATVARKTQHPVFEKSVETNRGKLSFRSITQIKESRRQLLVSERHTLEKDGEKILSEYDFVMRCWTKEELHINLSAAGFHAIQYFGGYDADTPVGERDRLIAVASF
jgi:ubiquinone/menaquinone biosynthesis C-methylase UbiE